MAVSNDNSAAPSKKSNGHSVSVKPDIGTDNASTDQNSNEWFVCIVNGLYQKDAGLALATVTGFEERTCYRYAAGDRRAPGYLLYVLLRSSHGHQWLSAIMDGSTIDWWEDLQRDRKQAEAARSMVRGMESL